MNYSEENNDLYGTYNLSQECNSQFNVADHAHPCFTYYGCPIDMATNNVDGSAHMHGSSKIPRSARQRVAQRVSPRPNLSFLNPVFHERKNHEDDAVLTQQLWKLARKSGTLNLSNKGLARVPERIYDINEADADSKAVNLEELCIKEEDAWWNQVPLTNLDLSSNTLTQLSPKIENLCSLTVLNLHDNALVSLPAEIGKLEKLMRLNVSHNKLSILPRELYSLPELRHLNISYNEFTELDPDISDLHMLEFLDAGHNNIQTLPGGIGFLVRLTALLLPYNHIKEIPSDLVNMRSLQKLDLMQNDLTSLPEDIGLLRKLQCLYAQHNDIKMLPDFEGSEELSEVHASNNFIDNIPKNMCANLPHLKILDLRDNQISEVPDEICLMRNLHRFDISNNSISNLPVTLSSLAHLVSLQVEGNPIKTIRRDILQCGTSRILKTLHDRAMAKVREETGSDKNPSTSTTSVAEEGLRLRGGAQINQNANYPDNFRQYQEQALPSQGETQNMQYQYFSYCQQQQQAFQAPHNNFFVHEPLQNCAEYNPLTQRQLYEPMHGYYKELNQEERNFYPENCMSNGPFAVQPRWVYKLRHTRTLAVNMEELTDVPDQVFELAKAENVHVVDFARNHLANVPNGLQHMSDLVTELVLSNNHIGHVPQFISQFTRITFINLSNNLIKDLPQEFGILNTLRELNIANNRFEFLPNALYELQGLEILIANDNNIKILNVSGLGAMRRLSTLDLRNNDIEHVPPTLGNLTNITHLELIGNPFRQPRHQILVKGTESIMSYLRDRIPI